MKFLMYSYTVPPPPHPPQGETTPETTEIWTHICSCHNFPPPFFCEHARVTHLLICDEQLQGALSDAPPDWCVGC